MQPAFVREGGLLCAGLQSTLDLEPSAEYHFKKRRKFEEKKGNLRKGSRVSTQYRATGKSVCPTPFQIAGGLRLLCVSCCSTVLLPPHGSASAGSAGRFRVGEPCAHCAGPASEYDAVYRGCTVPASHPNDCHPVFPVAGRAVGPGSPSLRLWNNSG